MKRSTVIGLVCLAVMVGIYLIEPDTKRPETLVIIVLMVIGLIVERLFYRRTE